jgi:hypothetical protein
MHHAMARSMLFPSPGLARLGKQAATVSLITDFVQDLFRFHPEIRLPNV